MLSLEECIGLSGLTDDEVAIIAEHEHVPPIVAAELGSGLLISSKGLYRLHMLFRDCLDEAARKGRRDQEKRIGQVYARFRSQYPMPRML